jgi:hypothetical protein
MVRIYERAKAEINYVATRFLQLVSEKGGVEAARQLITSDRPSDGFTTLWERGGLDLSVEALVLRPEFQELFTDHERTLARERLRSYDYQG